MIRLNLIGTLKCDYIIVFKNAISWILQQLNDAFDESTKANYNINRNYTNSQPCSEDFLFNKIIKVQSLFESLITI